MIDAQRDSIIDRAAEGATLRAIAEALGVNVRTLFDYRRAHPEFAAALERAAEDHAESWLDDLRQDVLNNLNNGVLDPAVLRVKLELARFYLEKRFPNKYGARVNVDVKHHVDISGALDRARARRAAMQVIDGIVLSSVTSTDGQSVVALPNAAEPADIDPFS
ncbi:MAG: helix-turn-helix domain-containing protein [Patescibacteria group bacterium]|nr:helix-turn-helix domain-containing protein [Patescibacteria group bacterium]